jgi:hypothetical protein
MGVSDFTLLMLFVRLPAAKGAGKWMRARVSLRACEGETNSNSGGEKAAAACSPRLCGQARDATRTESPSMQQPLRSPCLCLRRHARRALGLV